MRVSAAAGEFQANWTVYCESFVEGAFGAGLAAATCEQDGCEGRQEYETAFLSLAFCNGCYRCWHSDWRLRPGILPIRVIRRSATGSSMRRVLVQEQIKFGRT